LTTATPQLFSASRPRSASTGPASARRTTRRGDGVPRGHGYVEDSGDAAPCIARPAHLDLGGLRQRDQPRRAARARRSPAHWRCSSPRSSWPGRRRTPGRARGPVEVPVRRPATLESRARPWSKGWHWRWRARCSCVGRRRPCRRVLRIAPGATGPGVRHAGAGTDFETIIERSRHSCRRSPPAWAV